MIYDFLFLMGLKFWGNIVKKYYIKVFCKLLVKKGFLFFYVDICCVRLYFYLVKFFVISILSIIVINKSKFNLLKCCYF